MNVLTGSLRGILLTGSLLAFGYILYSVRRAKMQIEYCIFWLLFGLLLVLLAAFPGAVQWASRLMGFEAPSNFIFLVIITVLMVKLFTTTVKLSKMDTKLTQLTQRLALDEHKQQESTKKEA